MLNLTQIPFLAGAVSLFQDKKDPRSNLAYILVGGIFVLIFLEATGIELGSTAVGQAVISGFSMMLGYFFAKKEHNA